MRVIVAPRAGFCGGVKRAVDMAAELAGREACCSLGPLVHNKRVCDCLNVRVINDISEANGETVIIRAHGAPLSLYKELELRGIKYLDCACPRVRALQEGVKREYDNGRQIIIAGDKGHAEVVGVNGWCDDTAVIVADAKDCEALFAGRRDAGKVYALFAQTTMTQEAYAKIKASVIAAIRGAALEVFNTICRSTQERQIAAKELADIADIVFVFGDNASANSRALYDACKSINNNSFFCESIENIRLQYGKHYDTIGICAGASTPRVTLEEALSAMADMENNANIAQGLQPEVTPAETPVVETEVAEADEGERDSAAESFEQMLNGSIVSLHTGDIVAGTVISVINGEVLVNLGYKSDGVIPKGQFSNDPDADAATLTKAGDNIDVFVVRVNDGDGNVMLSHKKVSERKDFEALEQAAEDGAPIKGKFIEVVKGGAIALIGGVRAFVPSSQASDRFVKELGSLIGQEHNFQIIQYEKAKRRVVAGRRELAAKEAAEKKTAALDALEPGSRVTGTVSRIADFGAFVDVGGVDGLIHISRLSWGRVKKVTDVLKEGQEVTVWVNEANKETGKVSLSLKDINADPWAIAARRYPINEIVEGTVVRLVPFGAFIALEDGIDGLVHISQIADRRIERPEDVLTIGETIQARVLNVDTDKKRISLSIRAVNEVYGDEDDYDDGYEGDYAGDDYEDSYDDKVDAVYDAAGDVAAPKERE